MEIRPVGEVTTTPQYFLLLCVALVWKTFVTGMFIIMSTENHYLSSAAAFPSLRGITSSSSSLKVVCVAMSCLFVLLLWV